MKGIILAGGQGTRLRPLTRVANKHLLPVYDKPMIYYPLQTLVDMGCDEIMIVSGGEHIGGFAELLGDGSDFEVKITYRVQADSGGVAQALGCARGYVEENGPQQVIPVILGDNYFEDPIEVPSEQAIVIKPVKDANRFGVYHPGDNTIEEKPDDPQSNLAVTGLYFYKPRTFNQVERLQASARGELEITDINNFILQGPSKVIQYEGYWTDMGTFDSLNDASNHERGRRENSTI